MKKLIMFAAIAFVAATSQAVTVNWGLTGNIDATKFASGTAYLICVDNLARPSLTDATAADWYKANASSLASKAFRSADVVNGAVAESEVISEAIGRKNYWLIIDNNATSDADHYFSVATSNKGLNISTGSMTVSANWTASTQMATYAAVPEPTSGLLMLLGMAGLALKRKRA